MERYARLTTIAVAALAGACTEVSNEPAAITVSPPAATLFAGDTLRFHASVTNRSGDMVAASVTWQSSDASKVTIDGNGLATVVITPTRSDSFTVQVKASVGAVTKSTTVAIAWRAPLEIWPDTNVLFVGMTRRLKTRFITSLGGPGGPEVADAAVSDWRSSDASIASVDGGGLVTAKAVGQVRILAFVGARVDTAELYVRPAPSTPLRFTDVSGSVGVFATVNGEPKTTPHSCGLTEGGDVYCWGLALDAEAPTDRCETEVRVGPSFYSLRRFRCSETPYKLSSPVTFTSIAARGDMGCGVATSKKVYCWGSTGSLLGAGNTDTLRHGVAPVASGDEFISVHVPPVNPTLYARSAPVCGLRTDRMLICWGRSLGAIPVVVGTMTWRAFASASRCGIAADSAAYCFPDGGVTLERLGTTAGWAAISTGGPVSYPIPGSVTVLAVCMSDSSGQVVCGGGHTALPLTTVAGIPAVSRIDMFGLRTSDQCGLSQSGDVYCFFESGTADKKIDLGGVQLKRFFGACGIAVDDRAYCWTQDPATGTVAFRRIPGQP